MWGGNTLPVIVVDDVVSILDAPERKRMKPSHCSPFAIHRGVLALTSTFTEIPGKKEKMGNKSS